MGNISALAAVAAFVASLSLSVPSWAQANFGGVNRGAGSFHGGAIGGGAARPGMAARGFSGGAIGAGRWQGQGMAGMNRGQAGAWRGAPGGVQGRSMVGANRGQAAGAGVWRGGWQGQNWAGGNRGVNRAFVANKAFSHGFQNRGYYRQYAQRRFNRNAIVVSGLALGYGYPYYGYDYGYPYDDAFYGGSPYPAGNAPLTMGRSVATGEIGRHCDTPQKICVLYSPSTIGGGCSCKIPGGRARGAVSP